MKKFTIRIAAMAVILCSAAACGANNSEKDSQAQDQPTVEDEIVDALGDEELVAELQAENEGEAAAPAAAPAQAPAQADKDGYTTTASGLKYKVLKEGNGKSPKATDNVTVHYEGKLTDGTVFDSSYKGGSPITFPLNRVIPGWTEGLQLMKEGAVYEFYIPYQLAYGEQGTPGGPIGPKADLIFKVELIKVQ